MIIGICGLTKDKEGAAGNARAGKDTAADRLVEKHGFVKVSLADEIKRNCIRLWRFTPEQMWGDLKEVPDERYPTRCRGCQSCEFRMDHYLGHLTPRFAMQRLGTEVARQIDDEVWIRFALDVAYKLLYPTGVQMYRYTKETGLYEAEWSPDHLAAHVVVPDVRRVNEALAIQNAGGNIVCVTRELDTHDTDIAHVSESSAEEVSSLADYWLVNNGTIEQLHDAVDALRRCMALEPRSL